MAKVNGPLHSQSASGSIGQAVTFRKSPHGTVALKHSFPGSRESFTPSGAQLLQRLFYGQMVEAWHNLTPEAKAVYTEAGHKVSLNGWQYFVSVAGNGIVLPNILVLDSFTDVKDTLLTDHIPDYDFIGSGWVQGYLQAGDPSGGAFIKDNELHFSKQ